MEFLTQIKNSTNGTSNRLPQKALEGIDKGDTHAYMMIVAFIGVATIGLWALAFKQYKISMYIHFVCMGIVTILVWMSGFLAIT